MKKTLLFSLGIMTLLMVAACFIIIAGRLLYLDTYKDVIISTVEKTLNRRVTYKSGNFSLGRGATFVFTGASVMERDGSSVFVSSERIDIRIALLPLIEKKLILKEIILEKPRINLTRFKNGSFNFSDILEGNKEGIPLLIRSVRIINGSATFADQAVSQQGVITSLSNIDLFISRLIRGKKSIFNLSATFPAKSGNGKIEVSGAAKLPPKNIPLQETRLDVKVTATSLNPAQYWDYFSRYVPFLKIYANIDLDSIFIGKLSDFSSSGTAKVTGLYFNYPQVFHSVLSPKEVRIKYNMQLTPKDLVVKHLALDVDNLSVIGSCALKDIYSSDLFISAKAVTNHFLLEKFAKYIPYGIIPKDTSEFIEERILGGTYKLQDGILEGRVSQIAHMEKGTNYNVLSIKGTVDRGLVSFGRDIPAFSDIKGNLALRGKDFILSGMEGRFGGSPFKLDGKIADYPLKTPTSYPFSMTMVPDRAEVVWLLDRGKPGMIGFKGPSTLNLSGSGTTANYVLSGKWDISPAAYKYSNIISKPAGEANRISFKGSIGKGGINAAAIRYSLKSMDLIASGIYRPAGIDQLDYSISSNMFPVQDVAQMIPELGKYGAQGLIKAAIHGKITREKTSFNNFHGNIFLSGVSVKPSENMKVMENINGNLMFSDNTVSTSLLSAKVGDTMVSAKGTLTGFKNPTLDVVFSSPELNFADFGFSGKPSVPPARNVHGSFTLKEGNLDIRELSFLIGKSVINAHGAIEDLKKPVFDIYVHSPFLDIDDLLSVKGLEPEKKPGEKPLVISGKIGLNVDAGNFRQLAFDKLKTSILVKDKSVRLQPVTANVAGGTVYARGHMDFNPTGKSRYRVSFNMKNLSAARIQQAFDFKREVTGTISMDGDLSGGGDNLQEIKKSIQGKLKLNCENGSLKKFAVLSKIFSILNFSQLFKFQLPDMVSGGMPYNKVTGTFVIQNGIATTDDFFIDSDAINISVLGKFDLPEEKLDLTVGVKPLQTVDKIVSHIPIVGWVLTGKNKSLVTAYFAATGSWDNPQVRAIPLKSMAKGVFNIFKRVFQLPAKIFTDTGEVVIGAPD